MMRDDYFIFLPAESSHGLCEVEQKNRRFKPRCISHELDSVSKKYNSRIKLLGGQFLP